jgi:sulfide:quinone oxidoreductase
MHADEPEEHMGPNKQHRVLIAGGGVGALEAMIALRAIAGNRVAIDMLAPNTEFRNRPLSVRAPFETIEHSSVALATIADDQGASLHHGTLTGVDSERHLVRASSGVEMSYDSLVITVGARRQPWLDGAVTFGGPEGKSGYTRFLNEIWMGDVREIVFAVPSGTSWPLPLYELALLTETELRSHRVDGVKLTVVTPEPSPLYMFGHKVGKHLEGLLERRGISLLTDAFPEKCDNGRLRLHPAGNEIPADRVVTIPVLSGPAISGLPHDEDGFMPTDLFGRVRGVDDVFAAGDACAFMVKQGGIATQQADAAAQQIAFEAGVELTPQQFKPVARTILYTGEDPLYIEAELAGGHGEGSRISNQALWWPPAKIAGKYLAPYIANMQGMPTTGTLREVPSLTRPDADLHRVI